MTRQDRAIIMVVLGVAVLGAAWFLLIKPKRQEAAALQARVEQAQGSVDAATARAAEAAAARAQYTRDYATVARLGKALPPDDDIASLVYQLDATADETGVNFRAVTVTDAAGAESAEGAGAESGDQGSAPGALPGDVTPVPITLIFSGGYFAMTNFLRKVERYTVMTSDEIDVRGRLVSIDSVTLTPGVGGFAQVRAEVTATAYRAPLAAVSSEPGAAEPGVGGPAAPATATAPAPAPAPASASSGTPAPPTAARIVK